MDLPSREQLVSALSAQDEIPATDQPGTSTQIQTQVKSDDPENILVPAARLRFSPASDSISKTPNFVSMELSLSTKKTNAFLAVLIAYLCPRGPPRTRCAVLFRIEPRIRIAERGSFYS